jgi:uncharacterized protein (DUF924 family)
MPALSPIASPEDVLTYWFDGMNQEGVPSPATMDRWFGGTADVDDEIRAGFTSTIEAALAGQLEAWSSTPRGRLALIIVLDQLTRNVYRGTPAAFSGDARAQVHTLAAVDSDEHRQLTSIECNFLYMPFEHAEDAAMQTRAVALYEELLADVSAAARPVYEEALKYAVEHREVIERFGRFPHRNAILGRESTREEREYLEGGGARFG